MLIGRVSLSEKGVTIVDVDGSTMTINAEDALDMAEWIDRHRLQLIEIVAQQHRALHDAWRDMERKDGRTTD